jgi:hypothetical protein
MPKVTVLRGIAWDHPRGIIFIVMKLKRPFKTLSIDHE